MAPGCAQNRKGAPDEAPFLFMAGTMLYTGNEWSESKLVELVIRTHAQRRSPAHDEPDLPRPVRSNARPITLIMARFASVARTIRRLAFLSSTLTVQSSSPEQFQKPAFDHGIAFDRPAALRGAYSTQNPTGPGVKRPAHFYISTRAFSTSGPMEIAGNFRPL
jgi:hypothetical protein